MNSILLNKRKNFLKDLSNKNLSNWLVVLGNQANDLDSLASSIAFSQLFNGLPNSSSNLTPVAIVQSSRNDINLRPENTLALKLSNIDLNSLIFLSDIKNNLEYIQNFALVDHFQLDNLWKSNQSKILSVIDHHENPPKKPSTAEVYDIRTPTGSCASLVTDNFKHIWSDNVDNEIGKSLADLLIQAIVIDTNNLKPHGKAQKVDHDAYQFLLPKSSFNNINILSTEHNNPTIVLYDQLQESKSDISSLDNLQLLRRDYKRVYTTKSIAIGLASVVTSMEDWITVNSKNDYEAFNNDLKQFAENDDKKEGPLDLLGVLTSYNDPNTKEHKRQLLMYIPNQSKINLKVSTLIKNLEQDQTLKLSDLEISNNVDNDFKLYNQNNSHATRKQVMPIITNIIDNL